MKAKIMLLCVVCMIVAAISCERNNQGAEDNPCRSIEVTRAEGEALQVCSDFGVRSFEYLVEHEKNGSNVLVSPLNIATMMGVLANGCEGETLRQITTTLGFSDLATLNSALSKMQKELPQLDKKSKFSTANAVWVNGADVVVNNPFRSNLENFFNGSVSTVNDICSTQTQNEINAWVLDKTCGMISNWLTEPLGRGTISYMASTLYFKGVWKGEYFKNNKDSFLFKNGGTQPMEVASMKGKGRFLGYESENMQSVMIPYGNEAFSMVLVLPKEGKSVADCVQETVSTDFKEYLRGGGIETSVDVTMPKFDVQTRASIKDMLKNMGVKNAFDPTLCEFPGFTVKRGEFAVSTIDHAVRIKVDENGTEAAAVTGIGEATSLPPKFTTLVLDRPFVFMIVEKSTSLPLFVGSINKL